MVASKARNFYATAIRVKDLTFTRLQQSAHISRKDAFIKRPRNDQRENPICTPIARTLFQSEEVQIYGFINATTIAKTQRHGRPLIV